VIEEMMLVMINDDFNVGKLDILFSYNSLQCGVTRGGNGFSELGGRP
jgi:hypothetical protein